MATRYTLIRKTFSQEDPQTQQDQQHQQKKGMSTGTKVMLGLGTLAGGFYGARKGMFGTGAAKVTNKMWGGVGKTLGSEGMMMSGSQGYGKAVGKEMQNAKLSQLTNKGKIEVTDAMTKTAEEYGKRWENKAGETMLNGLLKQ